MDVDIYWKTDGGIMELHIATGNENLEFVLALLDAGADVNAQDIGGWTPLHHMSGVGSDLKILSALLDAGADINIQDNNYDTPLHYAGSNSDLEFVSALLKGGADVNLQNHHWCTPLHEAAKYNNNPQVIEILLAYKSDPKGKDIYGKTVYDHIKQNDNLKDTSAHQELHDKLRKLCSDD